MDQQRWKKMEDIIDEALELDREKRETYISLSCKDDQELYHATMLLLHSIYQARDEHFLES